MVPVRVYLTGSCRRRYTLMLMSHPRMLYINIKQSACVKRLLYRIAEIRVSRGAVRLFIVVLMVCWGGGGR